MFKENPVTAIVVADSRQRCDVYNEVSARELLLFNVHRLAKLSSVRNSLEESLRSFRIVIIKFVTCCC